LSALIPNSETKDTASLVREM